MDIQKMIETFGLPVALVVVLMWFFLKEHIRLGVRVVKLEDDQKGTITELCKGSTKALTDNTAAMNQLCTTLSNRPCLMDAVKEEHQP